MFFVIVSKAKCQLENLYIIYILGAKITYQYIYFSMYFLLFHSDNNPIH